MSSFRIWCPSIRPLFLEELRDRLSDLTVHHIPGAENKSFSLNCNHAIYSTAEKYTIIVNDKARPKLSDVQRMISLLENGFGIVGFYRFGFFGIHNQLVKKMGGFDKRFVDGGYEDNDILIRMKQINIAVYMTEEIEYLEGIASTYNQKASRDFFYRKYEIDYERELITQLIPHERRLRNTWTLSWKFRKFEESIMSIIPLEVKTIDFGCLLRQFEIEKIKYETRHVSN